MVPYRDNGHLTAEQRRFNNIHSSTRVFIEQTFGILKKKFRILNFICVHDLFLAKHIIMACAVLHNFIIENEGPPDNIENYCENSSIDSENFFQNQNTTDEAKRKRERLTSLFSA